MILNLRITHHKINKNLEFEFSWFLLNENLNPRLRKIKISKISLRKFHFKQKISNVMIKNIRYIEISLKYNSIPNSKNMK